MDIPEANKQAWIGELTRHYRVAMRMESSSGPATQAGQGGK